jgi:DeoR/GlpR family transcriptional regulator of sugar metabolism
LFSLWALIYGPPALECLANYRAHWLFLSGQGLNEEGLFNPSALVVEAERAMVHCADKIVVMADHTKIGGKSMSRVCELEKIDILITTDVDENTDFLASLEEMGIEVIRVKIEGL